MATKTLSRLVVTHHPAAKHPYKAALICAIFGFTASALYLLSQSWPVTLALLCMMAFSLSAFFIPVQYVFEADGFTVQRSGSAKSTTCLWKDYPSYSRQKNGVVFWSRGGAVTKADTFSEKARKLRRSVFLPMDDDLWAECRSILESRLSEEKGGKQNGA